MALLYFDMFACLVLFWFTSLVPPLLIVFTRVSSAPLSLYVLSCLSLSCLLVSSCLSSYTLLSFIASRCFFLSPVPRFVPAWFIFILQFVHLRFSVLFARSVSVLVLELNFPDLTALFFLIKGPLLNSCFLEFCVWIPASSHVMARNFVTRSEKVSKSTYKSDSFPPVLWGGMDRNYCEKHVEGKPKRLTFELYSLKANKK